MTNNEIKEGFIKSFGIEAWDNEEALDKLLKPQAEICDYLGIELWPVIIEEIEEDSRVYFDKQYIALRKDIARNYLEGLKAITHECRHIYQFFCILEENTSEPLLPVYKDDFKNMIDHSKDGTINYYELPIEIDAFAFTKYYLNKVMHIDYSYPDKNYDQLLEQFITLFYSKGETEWKTK